MRRQVQSTGDQKSLFDLAMRVQRPRRAVRLQKREASNSVRHRASPHRIRIAKNRKGDERLSSGPRTRGSRGEEETPKRDRPQHGCYGQRVASWQALKGPKPQERRRGHTTLSACSSATKLIGAKFARRRRRDRTGDVRFVVCRRRVSNMPIGSAGPYAAMAKASRRRPTSLM